jgi:hypothetical protein
MRRETGKRQVRGGLHYRNTPRGTATHRDSRACLVRTSDLSHSCMVDYIRFFPGAPGSVPFNLNHGPPVPVCPPSTRPDPVPLEITEEKITGGSARRGSRGRGRGSRREGRARARGGVSGRVAA